MFPSVRAADFLAILTREPLAYRVVRQKGSHRRLTSDKGYPPLTFAFHDAATLPRGLVRKILTKDIGLSEDEALRLL